MFFQNQDAAFRLLGVYRVKRKKREISESDRKHCAISLRLSGKSFIRTDESVMEADAGCVAYFPHGCDYVRHTPEDEELIVLHLDGFGKITDRIEVVKAPETEPLFQALLDTWESQETGSYQRCMSLLYRIFENMQHQADRLNVNAPKMIEEAVHIIRRSFRDANLTVASLAKRCYVSEVYFRRLYRASLGESPLQTILTMRFDYALRLLRSEYFTTKEVAKLSGFSDAKYFRASFKKRFGISVSEYLKRNTI